MNKYYELNPETKEAVPTTLEKWAMNFEQSSRIIKQENKGGYFISTVFLGFNHGFDEKKPPILFETMVFEEGGNGGERYCDRCSTYKQALKMHEKALKEITTNKL